MQRYHIRLIGNGDFIALDSPCPDDDCTAVHLWVVTDDEYQAVNKYIRELDVDHIGTPSDDDDYIADAIDDFNRR